MNKQCSTKIPRKTPCLAHQLLDETERRISNPCTKYNSIYLCNAFLLSITSSVLVGLLSKVFYFYIKDFLLLKYFMNYGIYGCQENSPRKVAS